MIGKSCPECKQQIPVACKACPCGHTFFNTRKASKMLLTFADSEEFLRRTQRVRREKPNYYDSLEYDNMIKKAKQRNSECEDEDKSSSKGKRKKTKKDEEEDEETPTPVTPDKQGYCTNILAELNRRYLRVTWKPDYCDWIN